MSCSRNSCKGGSFQDGEGTSAEADVGEDLVEVDRGESVETFSEDLFEFMEAMIVGADNGAGDSGE